MQEEEGGLCCRKGGTAIGRCLVHNVLCPLASCTRYQEVANGGDVT